MSALTCSSTFSIRKVRRHVTDRGESMVYYRCVEMSCSGVKVEETNTLVLVRARRHQSQTLTDRGTKEKPVAPPQPQNST